MEAWQLAVLAVPAFVVVLSVVMIIRKLGQFHAVRPVGRRAALGPGASAEQAPRRAK